jgi:flagellar FliL protein
MADEEAPQGQPEAKGGLPLPLIIGVGAAVLLAVVYFFFLRAKPPEDEEAAPVEKKKEEKEAIYEKLEPLIVNPKDAGFQKFFTIKLDLLLANDAVLEALDTKPVYKTQITHALIELLSDKTVEELEGPTAKEDLKREILRRLNATLGPNILKDKEAVAEPVKDIYYIKYLIQ